MSENQEKPAITPDLRVGALLKAYPDLEAVLVELAPPFAKLRNPILRKTVAKVTSLRQAARVGNVPLAELINALRKAAGVRDGVFKDMEPNKTSTPMPDWFDPRRIVKTLDARRMIEQGEQPINTVMHDLQGIPSGKIYELITPFVPAPLVDIARKKGFTVWSRQDESAPVKTYFQRPLSKTENAH